MVDRSGRRAALYLRQSLDRAEGIERQRERGRALVDARGWVLVDEFVDNETRASKPRGPETAWGRMLPRIGKDFTVVIAVDLDRLLRSTRDLNTLIDAGAEVVTVDGEIDLTTADGEFRATMLAGIARFETRRSSERIKRQKEQRARDGLWHGGAPPYGYRSEEGVLVIEPAEAGRIHEVAKRLLDIRESMNSIVKDWNARGITTRGGHHWRQSNLRAIMRNRALLGETKAGVVGWEPIIDARTFDRLQVLFDDPARKITHSPGVKGGKYSMGGGLTVCAKCGKPLTSTRTSRGTAALICNKQVQGPHPAHDSGDGPKGRVKIEHDHLEAYVFGKVIALLDNTPRWQQRMSEPDAAVYSKIDALEAQRADLQDQRARAGQAFIAGIMTEAESKREVDRIAGELESLAEQINTLLGAPALSNLFKEGLDWKSWTPGQRRAALRGFIERIEVGDYPQGVARSGFRKSGETDAEYAERQRERRHVALDQRVQIVWKWAA
jgi:site-specific DNA recombinase